MVSGHGKVHKGRMMPLLPTEKRHWRLQVTGKKRERKKKKKTWQEIRSRESPKRNSLRMRRVFCSKVARQAFNFTNKNTCHASFPPHQFTFAGGFCIKIRLEGEWTATMATMGEDYTCMWRFTIGATKFPCYSVRIAHHEARWEGSCTN